MASKKYINIRGNARYRIRARTKEEALEIARERFEAEAFDSRQSFIRTGIAERVRSVVGFEAEPSGPSKTRKPERKLLLEWKNKPSQQFRTGDDKHPAFPRKKKQRRLDE